MKLALDDDVAQCNKDLALSKLEVDRKSEQNRKLQDELAAVKKVSCLTPQFTGSRSCINEYLAIDGGGNVNEYSLLSIQRG